MNDKECDRLQRRVQGCAASLMEHLDSVQIIATKKDGDESVRFQVGRGSWYERYGAVKDWIYKEEERSRGEARGAPTDQEE